MSLRSTVSRLAALALAAAALPSCGGAGVRPEESAGGDVLKISYFRVNPEPKTKKPEPTYRVVWSESWKDKFGESSREPLPRAAPNQVYSGSASDAVMRRYVDKLRDFGLEKLRPRNTDTINAQELYALAMDPRKMDPKEGSLVRVITVGTDKGAKSYFYEDQQGTVEGIETFRACERYVASIMAGHTISVRVVTEPR